MHQRSPIRQLKTSAKRTEHPSIGPRASGTERLLRVSGTERPLRVSGTEHRRIARKRRREVWRESRELPLKRKRGWKRNRNIRKFYLFNAMM